MAHLLPCSERQQALKGTKHLTKYEHYKALSTLYRIANLLAWSRALRRELFFIPGSDPADVEDLDGTLRSFCASLAEGRHIEEQRVAALVRLWDLSSINPSEITKKIGIQIDHQLKSFLHDNEVASTQNLLGPDQLALGRLIADTLTTGLGCSRVTDGVLGETVNRAMRSLAVREAWIYRDWQAAIGDLMLRQVQLGHRQFEVIGYMDFEAMCATGAEAERIWLRRLYSVIDDIDILGDQAADARIDQLREAHRATAKIISALHHADPDQSHISIQTRNAVTALLNR